VPLDDVGGGEPIEIRAFRGKREASVYRDHVFPVARFVRILEVADRERLTLLASLGRYGPELGKPEARQLAEEATTLRATGALPELDADLTAIAEVANWCARARGDSWLTVRSPRATSE
jgi:hypothetical protein